jgi:hypothetical protein
MLDKMKGQPWTMGEIVAKACMIQFAGNDKAKSEFIKCMHDSPYWWETTKHESQPRHPIAVLF